MARNLDEIRKRTKKKHDKVRAYYDKLKKEKVAGVQKYSEPALLAMVADKYDYSVKTVEDIVSFQLEKAQEREKKAEEAKANSPQLSILDQIEDESRD